MNFSQSKNASLWHIDCNTVHKLLPHLDFRFPRNTALSRFAIYARRCFMYQDLSRPPQLSSNPTLPAFLRLIRMQGLVFALSFLALALLLGGDRAAWGQSTSGNIVVIMSATVNAKISPRVNFESASKRGSIR